MCRSREGPRAGRALARSRGDEGTGAPGAHEERGGAPATRERETSDGTTPTAPPGPEATGNSRRLCILIRRLDVTLTRVARRRSPAARQREEPAKGVALRGISARQPTKTVAPAR